MRLSVYIIGLLLLVSCAEWKEAKEVSAEIPPVFPDYTEVTIPCNIAPLNFEVKGAERVQAVLTNGAGKTLKVQGQDHIEMNVEEWHQLTKQGGDVQVEVAVWNDLHPEGLRYAPFTIHVVKDEVDPYIVYRLLPPGYEGWNKMGIYQRNLTNFEVSTLIDNDGERETCMNCHAFNQHRAGEMAMHIRGPQGTTVIRHKGKEERIELREMAGGRHGSLASWHPSSRYVAFSCNDTKQIFYGRSQDKIEAFDVKSDMYIYDVKQHCAILDERFTSPDQWETFPSFSPDGKWLYFSVARPVHMPQEYQQLHYSLVRSPFDEKNGKLGVVDTIYNADISGGTALMPRISPDGRYLLYTVAESGAFNLYHKESDFRMFDLQTRQPVDCSVINSPEAESYHAWSSNGRWMMYSSKQVDGRYTRLFLSYWDGKKWGKPFLLPQEEPRQNTLLMMAYNVAEFVKESVEPITLDKK